MNNKAWISILALSFVWGWSFFFIELTLRGFEPLTVILLRVGIGGLALAVMYTLRRESWLALLKHWRVLLILAVFNTAGPHVFFAWGQQYTDSSLAAVINSVTPIPTFLLAVAIIQEKFNLAKMIGVVVGLGGVAILFIESINVGGNQLLGSLALIVPALFYAVGAVATRRYISQNVSSLGYATGMCIIATVILTPLSLIVEQPWESIPTDAIAWIGAVGLGLVATALPYPLFYSSIRNVGASNTVIVTMLVPIFAIIVGAVLLGEMFEISFFAGTAVIFIALTLVDGRVHRFLLDKLRYAGK